MRCLFVEHVSGGHFFLLETWRLAIDTLLFSFQSKPTYPLKSVPFYCKDGFEGPSITAVPRFSSFTDITRHFQLEDHGIHFSLDAHKHEFGAHTSRMRVCRKR